ncbi:proprotein convertase P-domain-containing protein [Saccharothrix sp.]|uniref:proprotein convertase P-domain-containing protein n=1 Tax=Saccharothrix sp. TaxID=1873460 RepID=UPI0028123AB4|nr:proprotein convertase P-domain-containing protein [Saccharothrix sp.]
MRAVLVVAALVLGLVVVTGAAGPAPLSAEESASAQARRTGRPVPVDALGAPDAEVVANADGSFTATLHNRPVRARTGAGWAPIDTTLVARPDGTVGPKVSAVPVAFSGGGDVPLARAGAAALDWPGPLPAPELAADTATYRDVLPGVDLKLTATAAGFTDAVVVRDAAAARDPRLRGLTLGGRPVTGRAEAAALDDPATAYPVTLTGPELGDKLHWMLLSHNTQTGAKAAYWDSTHIPRVGRKPGDPLRYRSYFEMNTAPVAGKHVLAAQLKIHEWWSDSCTPSPVELWHIGTISPATTWGDSTPFLRKAAEVASAHGYDPVACKDGPIGFDVRDLAVEAAAGGWATTTIALKAREDADSYGAKEFLDRKVPELGHKYAVLTLDITYNTVPDRASDLAVNGTPCGSDIVVNTPNPTLSATIHDADVERGHSQPRGVFRWWEETGGPPTSVSTATSTDTPPGPVKVTVPQALRDGVTYSFGVTAVDHADAGDDKPWCRFTVDLTKPTAAPTVTSPEYPPHPTPGARVFTPGRFTLDAGGDRDIVRFRYGIGKNPPSRGSVVEADAPGGKATVTYTPDTPRLIPGRASHAVSVVGVDRAGNEGPVSTYLFSVAPVPSNTAYAWWKADSVTTGALQDSSTSAYHAAISGPVTSTRDRLGGSTGAVRLDGVTSHAATTTPVAPKTAAGTFGSFTAMAWVKLDKAEDWATAVSQDGPIHSGFALKYDHSPRSWQFSMPGADGRASEANSLAMPQVGVWTHLAGVHDAAAGKLRLYVNGRLAGEADHTSTWYAGGPTAVGRAKHNGVFDEFWPGDLDDVQVYPWAAAEVEVRSRMGTAPAFGPNGKWELNEGTGRTSADVSTNGGNTLALENGASWATGRTGTGGALRFDGQDGHAHTAGPVAPKTADNTLGSFTVTAWVKLDELTDRATAVSQDGQRDSGFALGYSPDPRGWSFGMNAADADGGTDDDRLIADATPQTGVWTHLAAVYDHGAGTITLYVNAKPVKSVARRSTWYPTGALQVGRGKNDGRLTDHWPGEVDEVELTPTAMSAAQVDAAMAGPSFDEGGRWALNDNTTDATGHGHTLALWHGASWTSSRPDSSGRFDSGLRLDGAQGHAYTAGPVVRPDAGFTVAAWVKLDAVDRSQTVVGQDGTRVSGFRLHYDKASNAWAFTVAGDTRDGGTVPDGVVRGTTTPRAGDWTHLAGVYDQTARVLRLFVNGRLQATTPYTSVARADLGVSIGRARNNGDWADFLAGVVDEVELRPAALTAEGVFRISGLPVPSATESQPTRIEDVATAESAVVVNGLTPDMTSTLEVHVEITHTYRGDLVLRLVAPDATEYLLEDLTGGGDVDDLTKTYRLNASGELVNGTWKLRVEDRVLGDTGTIVKWSISAPVTDQPVTAAPWPRIVGSGFTVGNNTTTERSVTVAGIPGNAPTNLTVTIDKTWSWASDLKVTLVSPDNRELLLHDPAVPRPPESDSCGRPTDTYDIKRTYVVNAATMPANGVWKLRFKHTSSSGAPTVTAWSLSAPINLVASGTAPNTKFANPADVTIDGYHTSSYAHACGVPGTAAQDVRVNVDVRHPDRGDLRLELHAPDGVATYLLEDFPDDDSGDNVRKTYTVPGVAQLPNGDWALRVVDWSGEYVGVINEWSVQVLPAAHASPEPTWKAESTTDVPIVDDGWTTSPITVDKLAGMAPKVWKVTVDIKHTHRGDLALYLEAPDGTGYLLEDLTATGDVDDLAKTYTVNASSEIANGVWKLKVLDAVWGDVGHIDSWSLSVPDFRPVRTDLRAPIADLGTATSPLVVANTPGNAPNGMLVHAAITHAKPEQLVVTLLAPDGTEYVLHNRKPVLPPVFAVDATTKPLNGTWTLRAQDAAAGEAGVLELWGLVLAPAVAWPERKGSAFKVDGPTSPATGTSSVRVGGIAGNAPADLRVTVETSYHWASELKIALVAPDGTAYTLFDRGAALPRTFTVNVSGEVANGLWTLSVQRNSGSGTVDITSWGLWSPVNQQATPPGPVTKFANGTDRALPDDGWSSGYSAAWVSGVPGTAAKDLRVVVDVKHPNRGDLKLELRAPDGAATYPLEDVPDGDTGDDLFKTYTVRGVAQVVNGSWELVVTDTAQGNTGTIDGWSVQLLPTPQAALPAGWRVENGTDVAILDYGVVESSITVSGLGGMAPKDWAVSVAIRHTYAGDLTLHLVAPDGTAYLLEEFAGDLDDVAKTYVFNGSAELADGVWKLRVRDRVWGDVGHVDSWSLAASPAGTTAPPVAWPERKGSAFKVDGTTSGVRGTSSVRVAGVPDTAPADLRLTLATSYYWVSELKIALTAPDGTSYVVFDHGSKLPGTFTLNVSAEVANGLWTLSVQRDSSSGTVDITSWSLWSPVNQQATPPGPVTKFANGADVAIPDDGWSTAESAVQVTGLPGNAPTALRVSVDLKHPNRGDLALHLVAPDGTAYLLEDFPNADTGDNVFRSYVVNGSAETAGGSWRLRVADFATGNTGTIDGWSLHFAGIVLVPPGSRFENAADVPVPDNGVAESTVSIAGVTGPAPAGLKVDVVVRHAQRGDLVLSLIAPDGTGYPLEDLTGSGNGDDVVTQYAVNASAELANGTWRLRVADTAAGDVGVIDSWSLTFPAPTKYHTTADVAIPDDGSAATSIVPVTRIGPAPVDLRVVVDVKHPNRGDLVLELLAPDGSAFLLEDVPDGDTGDDVRKTYWVDASAEQAAGGWALRVRDTVRGGSGVIDAWSLQFGAE